MLDKAPLVFNPLLLALLRGHVTACNTCGIDSDPELALLALWASGVAHAKERVTKNGTYAEAYAGPAFASYLPIDPGGSNEHFTTGGTQMLAGVGYGFRFSSLRFDLGARLQYQALTVAGKYTGKFRDDAFRAHYTFVAPLVHTGLTTQFASRVNATFGTSLGSATYLSERQGARVSVRQIPFFGSLELGLVATLTEWLEAQVLFAWQPPLGGANVVATEAGFRVRL